MFDDTMNNNRQTQQMLDNHNQNQNQQQLNEKRRQEQEAEIARLQRQKRELQALMEEEQKYSARGLQSYMTASVRQLKTRRLMEHNE